MVQIDKMADNFDEGKVNKKDAADFLQVMNVVNDIKGQVKSLKPFTFVALRETLANVLASHPDIAGFANIKEIFEQLELAIQEEEQRIQRAVSSLINENNKATEDKRLEEEATEKAREEIQRRAEVAGVYKVFDSFHKDYLKEQKEKNKHLDDAIKAIAEGREIDNKIKKKLTKTPAPIEEEKRCWQHIKQTDETAEEEKKLHSNEIQNIKNLEQKVAHLKEDHPEKVSLANKRKYHEYHHDLAEAKIVECAEHYKIRDERAEKLHLAAKTFKLTGRKEAFLQNQLTRLQKTYDIAPKKISKGLATEETCQQTSSLLSQSESQVVELSQQKLDTTAIASHLDGKTNKPERLAGRIQKVLSGGKDIKMQLQEVGAANKTLTPNPTPPILKAKDSNKGIIGRD